MALDEQSNVVQVTATAFARAIEALRGDDVEVASCLLMEIETAIGALSADAGPGVELLSDLWRTAQEEAALAAARLQSRAAQHGTSQRAARAYR